MRFSILTLLIVIAFQWQIQLHAQSNDSFVPEAIVELSTGTKIRLEDFAFTSTPYRPVGSYYVSSRSWSADFWIVEGNFWSKMPLSEVVELDFKEDCDRFDPCVAEIMDTSGEVIKTHIAADPDYSFLSATSFQIVGKKKLLGVEGDFMLNLRDLKKMERVSDSPLSYKIVSRNKGDLGVVRQVQLMGFCVAPTTVDHASLKHGEIGITVSDGTTKIELKLKLRDIESITFIEKDKDKIRMKNGREIDGNQEIVGNLHSGPMVGTTESGKIWFFPNPNAHIKNFETRSITFLEKPEYSQTIFDGVDGDNDILYTAELGESFAQIAQKLFGNAHLWVKLRDMYNEQNPANQQSGTLITWGHNKNFKITDELFQLLKPEIRDRATARKQLRTSKENRSPSTILRNSSNREPADKGLLPEQNSLTPISKAGTVVPEVTFYTKAKRILPEYTKELQGNLPVRIRNPNEFAVAVGVRDRYEPMFGNFQRPGGKDLEVPANGVKTIYIPSGRYDIYFVYSNKPEALFQGDGIQLIMNGIEIQIVKVVNGNYSIRQVK